MGLLGTGLGKNRHTHTKGRTSGMGVWGTLSTKSSQDNIEGAIYAAPKLRPPREKERKKRFTTTHSDSMKGIYLLPLGGSGVRVGQNSLEKGANKVPICSMRKASYVACPFLNRKGK